MYYILQVELKEKLLQKPKGMLMIIYYFSLITILQFLIYRHVHGYCVFFFFFFFYVHVMNKKNVGFLLI